MLLNLWPPITPLRVVDNTSDMGLGSKYPYTSEVSIVYVPWQWGLYGSDRDEVQPSILLGVTATLGCCTLLKQDEELPPLVGTRTMNRLQ